LSDGGQTIRLDKWLWYARFFKTRSLSAKQVSGGHVRVNAERITKPAFVVRAGDTLTFAQGNAIRVVEIVAPGQRRGPAPEAATLYLDKSPPKPDVDLAAVEKTPGAGRPTKKDRRAIDKLKQSLE